VHCWDCDKRLLLLLENVLLEGIKLGLLLEEVECEYPEFVVHLSDLSNLVWVSRVPLELSYS
jgi:hypothetical protein